MWIFFSLILSSSVFALAPYEKLNDVVILNVLPNNIVELSRGLEDGLLKNDHVKLVNEVAGFSSRAICLEAKTETSYWRLYRIPEQEAFSKDYKYTMIGMADKEIPAKDAKWRDLTKQVFDETKPSEIKSDLPEKI